MWMQQLESILLIPPIKNVFKWRWCHIPDEIPIASRLICVIGAQEPRQFMRIN